MPLNLIFYLVLFTVDWGDFESGKLFPSHLICSSWQQRQLTLDKHYLHNARHTHDHNKGLSSDFPIPPPSNWLFVCEAVALPLVLGMRVETMARGALTVQMIKWEGLNGQSGPLWLATDPPVNHYLGASCQVIVR